MGKLRKDWAKYTEALQAQLLQINKGNENRLRIEGILAYLEGEIKKIEGGKRKDGGIQDTKSDT